MNEENRNKDEIWMKFAKENVIDERLNPIVAKSWRKCRDRGLTPDGPWTGTKKADKRVFQSILEANSQLLDVAVPIMEKVNSVIKNADTVLILSDTVGYVLKVLGDLEGETRPKNEKLEEGDLWDDVIVGTTSVSMVIDNDIPIQITGAEHFRREYHQRNCCSAPIHDRNGELIGTISLASPSTEAHVHSLALAVSMAFSIESMLTRGYEAHLMRVSMEGLDENIILLDHRFCLLYMNANAKHSLAVEAKEGMNFTKIMPNVDWSRLRHHEKNETISFDCEKIILPHIQCICRVTVSISINSGVRAYTLNLKMEEQLVNTTNIISGNTAVNNFSDIFAESLSMKKTVALAKRFALYDGPIFIQGEKGTGTDLFAQAIHGESKRNHGPFLMMDCATISRKQMQKELFGEEGYSLTKLKLADKGTLFLCSIDSMPLEFQEKLCALLTSLEQTSKETGAPFDVRLMASSSQNMEEAMEGYAWPGNIKELESNIKYSFFRGATAVLEEKDLLFAQESAFLSKEAKKTEEQAI